MGKKTPDQNTKYVTLQFPNTATTEIRSANIILSAAILEFGFGRHDMLQVWIIANSKRERKGNLPNPQFCFIISFG